MTKPNILGIIAGWLAILSLSGPTGAEPLQLTDQDLDRVAGGGLAPEFGLPSAAYHDRNTQISTQLSMPTSTAIAICLLCTGNASANAIANAIGLGQAGALSFTTGQGTSASLSNAVGPFLLMLPQAPPAPSGRRSGSKP